MKDKQGLVICLKGIQNSEKWEPEIQPLELEFHISRKARDSFGFEESFFKLNGDVIFPDFKSVQRFSQQLKRTDARPGEINAMGLIHEISHYVVNLYRKQENPRVWERALERLLEKIGPELDTCLGLFAEEFPPTAVYKGECTVEEYLAGESAGVPHRQVLLEEMVMLHLGNENPGFNPYKKELFDDSELEKGSAYQRVITQLELFFETQPLFGPGKTKQNLLTMLRSPVHANPSLSGQLNYMREHWGLELNGYLQRLLRALDFLKEEEKIGLQGPGETPVLHFDDPGWDEEKERFSPDLDWMPRLILMAKSTHVWLDQLSKKYGTHIDRLDRIPDEELNELAEQGFTGLWLIGLWERSRASERIKKMCGNPEAMASAYSIFDYRVAGNLGGEEALYNLKHRAWQRGIRLASDMVPNHMGIDSSWVVEHPDWFLSLDYCPFPSYTFNGPNLSTDDRVGIFLDEKLAWHQYPMF